MYSRYSTSYIAIFTAIMTYTFEYKLVAFHLRPKVLAGQLVQFPTAVYIHIRYITALLTYKMGVGRQVCVIPLF